MISDRAPEHQIDRYSGPYERWVFTEELGRPFAFPAIREGSSTYFTALLEGGSTLPSGAGIETRVPPLWNPSGDDRSVTPFAFHNTLKPEPSDATGVDTHIADMLCSLCSGAGEGSPKPRFRVNFPVVPEAWTPDYHPDCNMDDWVVPGTKPKAIVAVIDDGIPFAHRAFLDADGRTRMSHVWLQSARADAAGAVPFGRELMNGRINGLRSNAGADEDLIYRTSGAIDPSMPELGHHMRRQATHGSHIAGMSGGNDSRLSSHPVGDDVQMIAVQLPNTIAWDTSGFGKEMYMLSALQYVFNRARAIASKYSADPDNPDELPLIVNFSYGWSASRHDGQSEMELAIQELLAARKNLQPETALVMPTGNNFDNDMYGQITDAEMSGGNYEFGWQVLPDDRTSTYLEVWLPENLDPANYTVRVTPPKGYGLSAGGEISISPDPACNDDTHGAGDPRRFVELEMNGQNIGQLSADKHRNTRWRVMLALIPTIFVADQDRRAPAGLWTIDIRSNGGEPLSSDQQIGIWVQRDDDPASLKTGGRQSRLVDLNDPTPAPGHPLKGYSENLSFLRGYGCTNGVASSPDTTRVAGYVSSTKRPSRYSGSGAITRGCDGNPELVDPHTNLTAMADHSLMLQGTLSIGVRSGSGVRLSGTSGAAPAASRQMVINAAAGQPLTSNMGGPLPLASIEEPAGLVVQAKHAARTGQNTVSPIGKY